MTQVDERKPDLNSSSVCLFFILSFILLTLSYFPYLSGMREFAFGDCEYIYQPVASFVKQCLQNHSAPLWNPHSYCGFSQVAMPSPGIFYPFNYLFFLLPFSIGTAIYLIFHQFLSGLAMFYFVLKLYGNKCAALFSSLLMMFCGYMFGIFRFQDYAATVCFLLCSLAAALAFYRESELKQTVSWLLAVVSLSLLLLSGRPEIFVPGILLIFLLGACESYRLCKERNNLKQVIEHGLFLFLSLTIAILLACPALLPAWEWKNLSPRAGGLPVEDVLSWSATWYDWLSIVFFMPLGNVENPRIFHDQIHSLLQKKLIPPAYMGPGFFTAFAIGLLNRPCKSKYVLLFCILVAVAVCAGNQIPLSSDLLKMFPVLGILRYPVKLLIFALLPAIVLSAQGFTRLLDKSQTQKPLQIFLFIWTSILLIGPVFYSCGVFDAFLKLLCLHNKTFLYPVEIALAKEDLLFSFFLTGGFGIVFVVLSYLFRKNLIRAEIALTGIIASCIAPLLVFASSMIDLSADSKFYDTEPLLDSVLQKIEKKDELHSAGRITYLGRASRFSTPEYLKSREARLIDTCCRFDRDVLFPNSHFTTKWNYSNGYVLAETAQIDSLYNAVSEIDYKSRAELPADRQDIPLARYMEICASKYLICNIRSPQGSKLPVLNAALFDLLEENELLNLRIYRTKNTGKRLYFAGKTVTCGSWFAFEKSLVSIAEKSDFDSNSTYIRADSLPFLEKIKNLPGDSSVKAASIKLLKDEPCRIELSAEKKHPGLLVLRDQNYPGWHCLINGEESEIIRVNLFNKAVIIPAGRSKVVFYFWPESLKLGLYLAGLGAFLSAIVLVAFHLRKRRATSSGAAAKIY